MERGSWGRSREEEVTYSDEVDLYRLEERPFVASEETAMLFVLLSDFVE